jgi:two-component system NarL family response regulator
MEGSTVSDAVASGRSLAAQASLTVVRDVLEVSVDPEVAVVDGSDEQGRPDVALVRVLVVDDHAVFRRGMTAVLGAEPGISVVGEAADGFEAIDAVALHRPDVVLLDVRMPKLDGIAACARIKELHPDTRVVMLSVSEDETDLYAAIRAGASGFLLKEIGIDEVARAVHAVVGGQSLISPRMAGKLMDEFASLARRVEEAPRLTGLPRLTERELEVLRLVAEGLNNGDIAKRLFISQNTVKNHVRNILEKLQLHSRMEAVVYAVREKILDLG